jgi:hypothetical protein
MFYLFLIIAETTNMTSRGNPYRTNFNTRTGGAVSRAIQSSAISSDDLNPQNSWRSTVSSTAVSTTGTTEGVDLHRIGGAVSRQVQSITGNIQGNIINNNNPYVSHDDIVTNATLSGSSPPTNTQGQKHSSSYQGSVSRAAASGTSGTSHQKNDNKNKKKRNQWKR